MNISIALPSKTFLLGEYFILRQGAALLVNTRPLFEFNAIKTDHFQVMDIPRHSPAEQFITAHQQTFQSYALSFTDPYAGKGGLGASSAQFLGAYICHQLLTNKQTDCQSIKTTDGIKRLLACYQQYAWSKQGYAPSGADVIAQLTGQLTYFDKSTMHVEEYAWPFDDIGFCLLHTHNKLATHEHLKQLTDFNDEKLRDILTASHQALVNKDAKQFIDSIKHYHNELDRLNLVATHTLALLNTLNQQQAVLAAKGCGAMGADIILVIVKQSEKAAFVQWLNQVNLSLIADDSCLDEPKVHCKNHMT